jgi:hypothetical protein
MIAAWAIVDGEAHDGRRLARPQHRAIVDEASGVAGDGAGDAVFPAAPADDGPQLAHPPLGRIALSHGAKQRQLLLVHRNREGRLQDNLPRRPARPGEPNAKQIRIIEGFDGIDHRAAFFVARY